MLSYRHAFHAGNHADVLKHFVLDLILAYMAQKDKPFWYIDTHAGAGLYRLDTGFATQNTEFETGISRIADRPDLPALIYDYVLKVKTINKNNALSLYPGSPTIAKMHMRANDKMRLFELHPSDYQLLVKSFSDQNKHVKIEMLDGFFGIKSILPPPCKRAVVLFDPPYEEKQDYKRVVDAIKDSLSRFANGIYIVWYPLLQRDEPLQMLAQLKQLGVENWLNVSLSVQQPPPAGFGMYGSGLYIINPPWTLPRILKNTLPYLCTVLAQDESASYSLDSHIR